MTSLKNKHRKAIKCLSVLSFEGVWNLSTRRLPDQEKRADCQNYPDKFHTPSLIQTILSVLELRQISACALADFTADRELHPALKTFIAIQLSLMIIDGFPVPVNRNPNRERAGTGAVFRLRFSVPRSPTRRAGRPCQSSPGSSGVSPPLPPIFISCHFSLVMRSCRGLDPSKGPT